MNKWVSQILLFLAVGLRLYTACWVCVEPALDLARTLPFVEAFRQNAVANIRQYLPSQHSELLVGLLLGIDKFTNYDVLVRTGTIHVVVVSGYNISLVSMLALKFFGGIYRRRNFILVLVIAGIYAIVAGGQPPALRAWVMSAVVMWGKIYGRRVDSLHVLVFAGLLMILVNPLYLKSLSFQLSFLATLGLILYADMFENEIFKHVGLRNIVISDFSVSIAAQVLVTPLILYRFGRLSLISPFVNALLLWTIPLSTVFGAFFLLATFLNETLALVARFTVFPWLEIFIGGVTMFSKFKYANIDTRISLPALVAYYVFIFLVSFSNKKERDRLN